MMENAINSFGAWLGIFKLFHLLFTKTLQIKIYTICGNNSRDVRIIAWFQKEKKYYLGEINSSTLNLVQLY